MKLYLKRGAVIGFVVTLAVILVLGVYSYLSIQRVIKTSSLLSHSLRVVNNAERVLVTVIDMETGMRGFVITGDADYLQPYHSAVAAMDKNIKLLVDITAGFPEQQRRIRHLRLLAREKMLIAREIIDARRKGIENAILLSRSNSAKDVMDKIRVLIDEIKQQESALFRQQNTITGRTLIQFQYSFMGLLIVPAVIIVTLFYSLNTHLNRRTRTEQKFQKASGEILQLNNELEAFTYSVSHDLRAPLRSVAGYSQILKEDYAEKLDEEGKRVIDVIINNARRMGQLIDDLLDFSRFGRTEINKVNFNVKEMVSNLVQELTSQNGYQKAVVNVADLEPVQADVGMMQQVWINLISNALKYSGKKDSPQIEIGSYSSEREVCYFVKDNGVGFNMVYVDKLFGVFQRLHKTTEFEGTGVGLALVKRIVGRHGGRVWAEGRLNEGAQFFFTVPKQERKNS